MQEWASPLPYQGFFFPPSEYIIEVWALKAHCAVRCVVTFVSRSLYTWTALNLFFFLKFILSYGCIDKVFT